MTPSLTSPTRDSFRKTRTASAHRSSNSRSHIAVLRGIALACLTRKPEPLLLLSKPPLTSDRPPEACPTAPHNPRISLVQAVPSLKRCSLICLLLHRQQMSLSAHPYFPPRKGTIRRVHSGAGSISLLPVRGLAELGSDA